MKSRKTKHFARKLFQMSLDERGCVSPERVSAVLAALDKSPPPDFLAVLREFKVFAEEQVARNTARVEHAGPVAGETLDAIAAGMSRFFARPVVATAEARPDLLAGLRVRVGDDFFESSVAGRLEALGSGGQF